MSVEEVEARRKRGDDFILLDVREKDEVRAGYIDGAVTIPRGFEFQAAGQIPNTDKDVVVYCAGGARSLLAAKVLRSMGYDRVSSLAGGSHAGVMRGMLSCAIGSSAPSSWSAIAAIFC